jgi:RND family efflux transporter MFP subunit
MKTSPHTASFVKGRRKIRGDRDVKQRFHTMKTITLVMCLLVAALSFSACSRKAPKAGPPAPEVLVVEAATRDVPVYREWVGTIDGSSNADIRARVSGHLVKRGYIEGALVKEGDLLFEIDPRPFEAALAKAKANLENARATETKTDADEKRAIQLFNDKVTSAQERDATLQSAPGQRANVSALEAAVREAELNLGYTKIGAPVGGIAGMAKASVGDLIGNDLVLTTISRLDLAQITFPVSETDYFAAKDRALELLKMPIEQRPEEIELVLADGSSFPHKARLDAVDRQAQTATGTILVNALVKNQEGVLRPGFFARARVVAEVLKDAVVVPQRAVSEVQGSYSLAIIGAENKVEIRPVKVGARRKTDWVMPLRCSAGAIAR